MSHVGFKGVVILFKARAEEIIESIFCRENYELPFSAVV